MGKHSEMEVMTAIVQNLVYMHITQEAISREDLRGHVCKSLDISERAYDNAFAFILKTGMVVKRNRPYVSSELNARGQRRHGVKTFYEIDPDQVVRLNILKYREYMDQFYESNYGPEVKTWLLDQLCKVHEREMDEKFQIILEMQNKYPYEMFGEKLGPAQEFFVALYTKWMTDVLDYLYDKEKPEDKKPKSREFRTFIAYPDSQNEKPVPSQESMQ